VTGAQAWRAVEGARVLPPHLESNFNKPEFRGAQPLDCLCTASGRAATFTGADILSVIDERRRAVGIVTLAPELDGGIDLIRRFVARGIDVSLGHTAATYEETIAAIDAGASRVTHIFSAMRPFSHRDPGVIGAVLTRRAIATELIADGVHAHPASVALVLAAKSPEDVIAITDGTAASGLPRGSRAHLGWRPVTALDVARYDDGSLAGSIATMDRVFRVLVQRCGCDLVTAARTTATNPARDRGLEAVGFIERGARADVTVLSRDLEVLSTWIGGELIWRKI
jgi:N-acetylglucosamine-6-phosphate deacetylase